MNAYAYVQQEAANLWMVADWIPPAIAAGRAFVAKTSAEPRYPRPSPLWTMWVDPEEPGDGIQPQTPR